MKIKVYAVYDSKTKVYAQPNFLINRGAAMRAWKDACNDPQTQFFKHPEDFTMFELGTWDDETGQFEMDQVPFSLGTAIQYKDQSILRSPSIQPSNILEGAHQQ